MTTLASGIKLDSSPSEAELKVRSGCCCPLRYCAMRNVLTTACKCHPALGARLHGSSPFGSPPLPVSCPQKLGVTSWPTWGCEASKLPWTYDSAETAYLLRGRVVVTPDGGEPVEVKAGER